MRFNYSVAGSCFNEALSVGSYNYVKIYRVEEVGT